MSDTDDFIGKVFDRLKVTERLPDRRLGKEQSAYKVYKCECSCGKIKEVLKANLQNGTTRSCGCYLSDKSKENIKKAIKSRTKYFPSEVSARRVFKRRYSDGNLSFDKFKELSQLNCYYCNQSPNNCFNVFTNDKRSSQFGLENGKFIYNGLDRIDSSKSHTENNVITCCMKCNFAKCDLSYNNFINHIQLMNNFRSKSYNNSYLNIKLPNLKLNENFILNEKNNPLFPQETKEGNIFGNLTVTKEAGFDKNFPRIVLCKCKCGNNKRVRQLLLLNGTVKSCGLKCKSRNVYAPEISIARCIWINSQYKKEGLKFEEFYELSQMNCYYCNNKPSNNFSSKEKNITFIYNGLDRLDSSKYHTIDNVIPSCLICNRAKNKYSLQDFDLWLNLIFNNLKDKICFENEK